MKTIFLFLALGLASTTFAAAQRTGVGEAEISIPGVSGVLQLNVGTTNWESRVRSDGKETQMRAMNRPDHLVITAFLQRVDFAASAGKCRAEWWAGTEKGLKKNGFKMKDVQMTEREGIAVVSFFLPEVQGKPVRQQSLHAYLGGRDLCAEIHMSKALFEKEDEKLFEEVLATLKLLPDQAPAKADQGPSQAEKTLMAQASRAYLQHDYATAAKLYQGVLDAEKQKPGLDKTMFRVLVDNLGMSYGLTGDMAKAKQTFEYGVAQQPDYPLFHYNLACTYGEMGKMDDALAQLRLAYKYKTNMIPGEKFPDPLTDDSFRNFVKDKKFVDAVRALQGE